MPFALFKDGKQVGTTRFGSRRDAATAALHAGAAIPAGDTDPEAMRIKVRLADGYEIREVPS